MCTGVGFGVFISGGCPGMLLDFVLLGPGASCEGFALLTECRIFFKGSGSRQTMQGGTAPADVIGCRQSSPTTRFPRP